MIFQPLNLHIEVKPFKEETIIERRDHTYEERGEVLSIADGVTLVAVGDVVFFDSWLVAQYQDSDGNKRFLVPQENVRAKEING